MINEIFQFSVIQNQSLTIRNGCKLDDITCILVLFFSCLELVNFVESESSKRALHGGLFFLKLRTKHGKEIKYLTQ